MRMGFSVYTDGGPPLEGTPVTRRVRARYCEALREGGLLVIVFTSLDSAFGVGTMSVWRLVGWTLAGFANLLLGIYWEPKP
jgi:hypothetical protein